VNVTEYRLALYLGVKVGYPGTQPDRGHAVAAICVEGPDGGPRGALRAGECQEAQAQIDQRGFAAAHYEGLNLMTYCTASAAPRPASRTVAAITATPAAFAKTFIKTFALCAALTAVTALTAGSPAFAQQPDAAAPAPAPKPAKKPKPKPAPEAQQTPAPAPAPAQQQPAQAQPGQGGDQGQQAQNGQQQVQLIFSPWTKFCLKGQPGQPADPNAKEVCFTGKDARVESGQPVAAAVIIEPQGADKKLLRVTLPLGMQLAHGTRVIVDQNQPMTAPYVICFTNGCMADYEASVDLIGKMKKGQGLVIQAINTTGQPISLVMPLADFAKAYDGPPTDPKEFEAQQKKLQDELQRRADEARKKLESQQGAPTSSATPPANGKTQ
jgi:invasion protein IalB